jgi:hypothetical protein
MTRQMLVRWSRGLGQWFRNVRVVVAGRRAAGRRVASRRRTSQRYGDTVGQEPGRPASWGSFAVTRRIQVTSVVLSLAVALALAGCGGGRRQCGTGP